MGTYINKGNIAFQSSRNSEYVDKSALIAVVNQTLFTRQRFSCVSRCRRFGKSMAAEMLCAYYDKSCQSRQLFQDLKIVDDPSFEQHLNKYAVVYVDMTSFITRYHDDTIVEHINDEVMADVHKAYPDVPRQDGDDLMALLIRINEATGEQFFFIADEWDAICREFKPGTKAMEDYLNWLRRMFKSNEGLTVFAGAYLTGILPIKKCQTQSAMNNFQEYSMIDPMNMAGLFGFTEDEVKTLADKHGMDYGELEKWYDGYQIGDEKHIFNPNSVMTALRSRRCRNYWAKTAAYETVSHYISLNFEGLKDDILKLLAGESVRVNTTKFQNDLSIVKSKDDVLTVLIHLGYLAYDDERKHCYVPNYEVAGELSNAIEDTNWTQVVKSLQQSEELLQNTLAGNSQAVARGIDLAHDENTSILAYNDENSMACVLSIAYYAARDKYIVHREYQSGKGFADLVMIPRKNVDTPAIIVELKYDKDADTAISQILRKEYPAKVAEYADRLLLVGITYDRETKRHECKIIANGQAYRCGRLSDADSQGGTSEGH